MKKVIYIVLALIMLAAWLSLGILGLIGTGLEQALDDNGGAGIPVWTSNVILFWTGWGSGLVYIVWSGLQFRKL